MQIVLSNSPLPVDNQYNMLHDGENIYWFHHKPSFKGLSPSLYENLISKATVSIDIWDPYYLAEIDHVVFENIQANVILRILSRKGLQEKGLLYAEQVKTSLKKTILESKNINFSIGIIDILQNKEWDFHDRYLIIDNSEAYLIGASVQYNHRSILSSGIYKLQNLNSISFIKTQFENHWKHSVSEPVQFLYL